MKQEEQSNGFGEIIGIIIVVLILLIGGLYFAKQRIDKSKEFQATLEMGNATTSDEVVDIENSASSMNFDNLGSGIDNL